MTTPIPAAAFTDPAPVERLERTAAATGRPAIPSPGSGSGSGIHAPT